MCVISTTRSDARIHKDRDEFALEMVATLKTISDVNLAGTTNVPKRSAHAPKVLEQLPHHRRSTLRLLRRLALGLHARGLHEHLVLGDVLDAFGVCGGSARRGPA